MWIPLALYHKKQKNKNKKVNEFKRQIYSTHIQYKFLLLKYYKNILYELKTHETN